MPHSKSGRLIKVGDLLSAPDGYATAIGPVMQINPGSETCNVVVRRMLVVHDAEGVRVVLAGDNSPIWTDANKTEVLVPKEALDMAAPPEPPQP